MARFPQINVTLAPGGHWGHCGEVDIGHTPIIHGLPTLLQSGQCGGVNMKIDKLTCFI